MHECMNKRALSQVRQPLDRIVSVQLKAGGRRKKRGGGYLQIADRAGEHGRLGEGSSNSDYSFLNHLRYSLEPSFVPAVVFSCAVPADKIRQAQTRGELGEPH